ncbi:MAG: class I SAM-dependent methyltransferase [Alphaproteobacteria bacterium]|nr:class I SAM-dependent methyltransferase [Alphaproteobacteria bacterium]
MSLFSVILLLLVLFLLIAASYEYYAWKTGVDTFPSMPAVRRKAIELLQKDSESRQIHSYTVLDLGSGSGQVSRHVAKAMPHAHVIGIELSFVPWLRSVLRQRLFGPANLEYKRLDFWPYDCSGADAVITYLPGKIMERAGKKLRKELKPGTLVVANTFPLRAGWEPFETFTLHAPFKTEVFVYRQQP